MITNFLGAVVVVSTSLWVLNDCSSAQQQQTVQPALTHVRMLEHTPPPDFQPVGPILPVTIQYMPQAMLPGACHLTPERLVGCSLLYRGSRCVIIVGSDEPKDLQEAVIAHERAHCKGWHHAD